LKILLGIGHPADVDFFKYFIEEMANRGHEVLVAAREKEITYYLLNKYKICYHKTAFHQKTIIKKIVDYFCGTK